MFRRHTTQQRQGRDEVHVDVTSGYRPALVTVRSGVLIRVVFHRHDDDPCTDRVIFSSPRIERRLAEDGATSVDIPARPAGEIRYTCGMGRYSGTIRVTEAAGGRFGWLRGERRAVTNAATVAILVVAVGLPIVAALGLLFLDTATATATTAIAVIAAASALVWMFGIPSARRDDPRRHVDATEGGPARRVAAPDPVESARRMR